MSWAQICGDLKDEAAALRAMLDQAQPDPVAETAFHGWRVRDCIGHMLLIDQLAIAAFTDLDLFTERRNRFAAGTADGPGRSTENYRRMNAHERSELDHLSWPQMLAEWDSGLAALCEAAAAKPVDVRVPWFATPMRGASLINARQMEVWAYGQDVFDLARRRRPEGDRIRNVAEFAIRVMGFSFANRGLPAPDPKPYIELTGPSGAVWTWNAPDTGVSIRGPAEDLCLVATQRRNVADTSLAVEGDTAHTWMRIAQCVAGPPTEGPAPGRRSVDYAD